ncbi:MAG: EAL domain-containing protein [Sulfurimonas sp.]|nr:EAL domain-containing protein [Sulfurimonas sp.]MDD5201973.1 EAL domain-containing protein [Sulfurimonas sp.]
MPTELLSESLALAVKKLEARENSMRQFEELSNLGSWEIDLKTNATIWSKQTYRIYAEELSVEPDLVLFFSHVLAEDLQSAQIALQNAIKNGSVTSFQCRIRRCNGEIAYVIINGQVIYDDAKNPLKIIGTTQDITQLKTIQEHSDELAQLIEYSSNEIYIVNLETFQYLYANKGACAALGYTFDEFLSMNIYDINPYLLKEKVSKLKEELLISGHVLNRSEHKRKDGSLYHVQSYIHKLKYNGVNAYVIFDTDISKSIEAERQLQRQSLQLYHQAHHDTLTDLPNRTLFKDRLAQAIISAKRNTKAFALLFIDLDQFKKINDSLGHHVGDEVLIEASRRFKNNLREEDTLARLGGDEFTIILKEIKTLQDIAAICQKMIQAIKEPMEIDGHILYISSSIGISLYPQDALSSHDLIKYADTAMYKAKDEGRDNFQFYSSDMTALAFERVVMESSLRMAIKEQQFVVYFQPQYNISQNAIIGMEALIRWKHPSLGLVAPSKFIPIAEESGLIIEIDQIVMKLAMKQFALWYAQGLNPGVLSLNLAMKQLGEKYFIEMLLETMHGIGFKPEWLELEVTEGQVMNNPDASIEKLKKISDIGVELAIDDFGTGYSSLAYLKKMPLNKLKIDRSFVKDLPDDEEDAAITKAIIALGKSLNLKLIAEGVETQGQRDFLAEHGCDAIQGYFYAVPMPAEEIILLLEKNRLNK